MNPLAMTPLCMALSFSLGDDDALASAARDTLWQDGALMAMDDVALREDVAAPTPDAFDAEETLPFGTSGTWRWHVGAGGAVDLRNSRNRLVQGSLGVSYFVVDYLSLDAELSALYVDQIGDDAVGANINLSFRHHLITSDNWSLYAEAGAGLFSATKRVPENGSRFNFTPHAGGGMSFDLGQNVRLFTGVRWHHISNANTYRDNPGRDSLQGYIQLSFPF